MNNAFVNLLIRCLALALGVALSTKLVTGISYDTNETLLLVVVVLTFFNAVLKPLLLLFTLPFIILSLGVGIWIINAVLLVLAGRMVTGFHVASFGSALFGALIISITNLVVSRLLTPPKPPGPPPSAASGRTTGSDDVIDI